MGASFFGIVLAAFAISFAYEQGAQRPEFDVATVKAVPADQLGDRININPGTIRNGRVTLSNVTLSDCIKFAYGIVSDSQIVGPDWIKRGVRFQVLAQTAPDTPQPRFFR